MLARRDTGRPTVKKTLRSVLTSMSFLVFAVCAVVSWEVCWSSRVVSLGPLRLRETRGLSVFCLFSRRASVLALIAAYFSLRLYLYLSFAILRGMAGKWKELELPHEVFVVEWL